MRYTDRQSVPSPKVFNTPAARDMRELLLQTFEGSDEKVSQSRAATSGSGYSVVEDDELLKALVNLFEGRCAFCESPAQTPLVSRFRPTAHAEPVENTSHSHLYYGWLAEAWQNLYLICADCVRVRAFNEFPMERGRRVPLPEQQMLERFVAGDDGRWPDYPPKERAALLDPCQDRQLWRHLGFSATGEVRALSGRGRATCEHFQLNREDLVSRRNVAFDEATSKLRKQLVVQEPLPAGWIGREPFPGATTLYLRDLLAQVIGNRPTIDLEAQVRRLLKRQDGVAELDAVRSQGLESQTSESLSPIPTEKPSTRVDTIQSITIRNFKSLEQIELTMPTPARTTSSEPLAAPSLLILGENAAGKSTILEAIALAVMTPEARNELKLDPSTSVLNPTYLGAPTHGLPSEAVLSLTFSETQQRSLTLIRQEQGFGTIRDEGGIPRIPLFAYGAFRQYLDKERKFTQHKHIRSLFEPDELLSNPERWLSRLPESEFNMVIRALREVFIIDGEFDVIERTKYGIVVVSEQHEGPVKTVRREPMSLVSSGFRAVLAMLCDIMQGLMDKRVNPGFQSLETAQGMVLIDEVEVHLHPRWKISILTGLRRALPRVSFIATSHDPLCLRGMSKEEVMVLERVPGSAENTNLPVVTQTLTNLPDNQKWTVEQLLTADFFQLRTTESLDAERRGARMEDKLAQGILPADDAELAEYLAEFSRDLPIGHTEIHRLVQDAIEKYLRLKRKETSAKQGRLKAETRRAILRALQSVG